MNGSTSTLLPVWAASSDARELWSIVALLSVIGIGLVMLAVAVFRVTRPDRELLAPLEMMGRRKWRNSDPVWQRRELDAVRPPEAEPLSPARLTPVPLEGFDAGPDAPGFDDLHDNGKLAPDELLDVGVDAGLVGLPGGEVFDSDPTPPSTEVPVIVAEPARDDLSLAQLGMNWSPPSTTAVPADAPLLELDDEPTDGATDDDGVAGEPVDEAIGAEAAEAAEVVADDETTDLQVDDEPAGVVVDDEAADVVFTDETAGAEPTARAAGSAGDDSADAVVDDETTDTVR